MKHLTATLLLGAALGISFSANAQPKNINIDVEHPGAQINPDMWGVFFEDINFAADGGLYGELVKNRSFDFPQPFTGWMPYGNVTVVNDANSPFDRNPNYVRIVYNGERVGAGLDNEGFRGIGVKKGEEYRVTLYARTPSDKTMKLSVQLVDSDSKNPDKVEFKVEGKEWKKYTAVIKASFTDQDAKLRVDLQSKGEVDVDHVSLFPVDTYKGRENGMRKDLAQALEDLQPGVLRFPGGCIIEGNELKTRYQWKNSVGPVENRPVNENRWNYTFKHRAAPDYFQSYGLGFFEYFQLAEDIGAAPLPVISCGLACQYEGDEVVPLDELQPYIDDALDLIEFANGPVTSTWGKVRADMGHPEPFNLKYLAVGNEQWGEVYPERLEAFSKQIRAKYPNIELVGSSGPSASGEQFEYLWPEMRRLKADLVDEHYYMPPTWFLSNADRYDNYDRKGPKVFAGEYASHDHDAGKANNWLAAMSEAAFMTGLERNADVVRLATYAPLFAHVRAWQWNPDMIWYDNLNRVLTPNYYVQKMYANNPGTKVLNVTGDDGKAFIGQEDIYASATLDEPTGEIIIKVVNTSNLPQEITLNPGKKYSTLTNNGSWIIANDNLKAVNTFEGENVNPSMLSLRSQGAKEETITKDTKLTLPAQSFSLYRMKAAKAGKAGK